MPGEKDEEKGKPAESAGLKSVDIESLSDEEVAERCKEEIPYELAAYRELLRRYEPLVHRTCLKMLRSVEDAEEICQDAFLRIYHKIEGFEQRAKFKTWLFRIVTNLCIDRRRKLSRDTQKKIVLREGILRSAHEDAASDTNKEQVAAAMNETLAKLKEDESRIIVLRFISGLSLEEISEVMDIGLSATKMRLYRALDAFKSAYSKLDSVPAGGVSFNLSRKK